jgi:hypothetical protein
MPERVQRTRTPGKPGLPAGALYVGRPTVFGNPWKVISARAAIDRPTGPGADWTIDGPGRFFKFTAERLDAQDFAVSLYRDWLISGDAARHLMHLGHYETREQRNELMKRRGRILGQLHTLAYRNLACWCAAGMPCHADVVMDLAAGIYPTLERAGHGA